MYEICHGDRQIIEFIKVPQILVFDGKDNIFLDVSDIYPAKPGNREIVVCINVPNISDNRQIVKKYQSSKYIHLFEFINISYFLGKNFFDGKLVERGQSSREWRVWVSC